MTPKIKILGQTFAHFGGFDASFLTILGVEKVVFWTFSKFFWSFLGRVWVLFCDLKRLLLVAFSARQVDKRLQNSRFQVKTFHHFVRSPLGSRKALHNRFTQQTGLNQQFLLHSTKEDARWTLPRHHRTQFGYSFILS